MSKSIRMILLIVGIALFTSVIYFALNSTNDHRVYELSPIELKVAQQLENSSVWHFAGSVYDFDTPLAMYVKDPSGNIITADTIIPDEDGNFDILITTGGPLWKQDGKYLLILEQGDFKEVQTFRVN
jgi:hypothetical protein